MKDLKDLFVPYEIAVQLKELGFDEPCFGFYTYKSEIRRYTNFDGELNDFQTIKNSKITMGDNWATSPIFAQAFTFFREKYKLYPEIGLHDREDEETWRFTISILGYYELAYNQDISKETYYKTYEEAELACLEKLIEIVKTK